MNFSRYANDDNERDDDDMTDNDRTPLVFEESVSPLYSSNDGRVKVETDRDIERPFGFVLYVDDAPVWSTRNRVLADAFIAGWDADHDAQTKEDRIARTAADLGVDVPATTTDTSGTYGRAVGPAYMDGPRSVIGAIETSQAGNVVLRIGRELDADRSKWTQTEHVVLTPDETRTLAAELLARIGVKDRKQFSPDATRRLEG